MGHDPLVSFQLEVQFDGFGPEQKYIDWLVKAVGEEQKDLLRLLYIIVSDDTLLALNKRHLGHDAYTDILTFPYSYKPIEAEIYISADRVRENASQRNIPPEKELRRLMIHGVLHMCGWRDATPHEKKTMRGREDYYLKKWEQG